MTIWIVCQQNETHKPAKVAAFKDKGVACKDVADRMSKAPGSAHFWLECVEMADETA